MVNAFTLEKHFRKQDVFTPMGSLKKFEPGQQLPTRKVWSSGVFIWSVFDIEKGMEPDMLLVTPPCLSTSPAQSVSVAGLINLPLCISACHYGHKGVFALLVFLSTSEHTGHSLPYQARYQSLLAALHEDYSGSQGEIDPLLW